MYDKSYYGEIKQLVDLVQMSSFPWIEFYKKYVLEFKMIGCWHYKSEFSVCNSVIRIGLVSMQYAKYKICLFLYR